MVAPTTGPDQAGSRALAEDRGLRHQLGVPGEGLLAGHDQRQRVRVRVGGEQPAGQVDRQQGRRTRVVGDSERTCVLQSEPAEQLVRRVERVGHADRHAAGVEQIADLVLAAAKLGERGRGAGQQVEQVAVRIQSYLVKAVEPAEEGDLSGSQSQAFADDFDRHGLGGKMDGHCLQCGHAG